MNPDPFDLLLMAVFDPSKARPSGRLRPVVVGRPHPVVRLPRLRRAGLVQFKRGPHRQNAGCSNSFL